MEKSPELSIVCALSENRVIGMEGKLPWYIPEDLRRFKALTIGHPIVMGRTTFESIGRILPNRTNIVVTRQESFQPEGVVVCHSVEEALEKSRKVDPRVFIIGGAQIYEQTLSRADRLYLTLVDGNFAGDSYFPDYCEFREVVSDEPGEDSGKDYVYRFVTLKRGTSGS